MAYQSRTIKGALYDKKHGSTKYLSDVVTVTYPDIEFLSETLKGAGINGEIDLPTYGQLGSLEVEVSHNGLSMSTVKLFRMERQQLEHRWASQVIDPGKGGQTDIVGKKCIFYGIPKKFGVGSIEPNKAEEHSTTFEVVYMKYMIGNKVAFEIDKLNDKVIIDGVNYSEKVWGVL